MWTVTDPNGRTVGLTFERWRHIVERHDALAGRRDEVMRAVSDPEERIPGPKPGEEWFFGAAAPPERWIKVVVHSDEGRGRIVTAFPRRWIP